MISTGGEGGAYQSFAARYRDVLGRYGIKLVEKPSAGSTENLARLRDPDFEVDAAFIQGGTARIAEDDRLYTLGDIYHEPLWIFYRESVLRGADKLLDLKGKRIAVGGVGSGTHHLAMAMLGANEIDEKNTRLLQVGGMGVLERFEKGEIDAAFVVGPTQSSLVWSLLYTPGIRLMNIGPMPRPIPAAFPYLAHLVLPRGAIDLTQNIPAHDTHLVSPMATLLVREETHPALIDLLMQAAGEVHGEPGVFQKPREFPRAGHSEFPLSKEAERYYKSGKPFLQRYLPFWAATLIDRMVVMIVPLLAVLIPLFKFAPVIYGWRVRSRIYRRYGELKFLENQVNENPAQHQPRRMAGAPGKHRGRCQPDTHAADVFRHALHLACPHRPGARRDPAQDGRLRRIRADPRGEIGVLPAPTLQLKAGGSSPAAPWSSARGGRGWNARCRPSR